MIQASDEQQIRDLVTTWLHATKVGDVDTVLSLVADDVVFLSPGLGVMRKDEFANVSRAMAGPEGPEVDPTSEIVEITIAGDWAFLWTRLRVSVTPRGGAPVVRAGHTLTVLRRERGRWVIARDANMVAPVSS